MSIEFLQLPAILDPAACAEIVRELCTATESLAPVYGGGRAGVQTEVRKVSRIAAPESVQEKVRSLFEEAKPKIETFFHVSLSEYEEPQVLHYRPGDYFVAHQDGNTPLTLDDSSNRRISVVLFLNDNYDGGTLLFHGRYPQWQERYPAPAAAGDLVAFRSETTHEVTPVRHGHRYTIVSWFR